MDGPRDGPPPGSGCLLVLCGKSRVEKDQARSLAAKGSLKLKHDGNEIAITLRAAEGEECSLASPEETFRTQMYMGALSTGRFGGFLLWSPCLPSTQDVVSQNFGELPIGAVCVADFQSRGRGRTKNVWESPAGCLMFSFTVEMEDGRVVPLLQYGLPPLDVKIKWPNDLYLNGLKIGGVYAPQRINQRSFQALEELYYRTRTGDTAVTIQLHPDGNSLDFFQGLVRRKLGQLGCLRVRVGAIRPASPSNATTVSPRERPRPQPKQPPPEGEEGGEKERRDGRAAVAIGAAGYL
ncbi:unnamed protein product [Spirodela intermedia]|uniref:BPL/LPL catalytic domain-containing protein n=1 Tax=Spirodela intermedia TaxID=51605 RepID=A0A7I8J558_SPIIN|nr:unnamed protein product [Spirodela intermedia]CAA6664905.1 unnamed protein product [Spirodela intermedia]